MSAAVPALEQDILAFTANSLPKIIKYIDFLNVMTYDMMNPPHSITMHHTGISNSLAAVDGYISRGVSPDRINLGFAFYARWFRTAANCDRGNPLGCKTLPLQDAATGADLGHARSFAWADNPPRNLSESFNRALTDGRYDEKGGGYYYWDPELHIWWTFDTPHAIAKKIPAILQERRLGGVFAWGLGEDGPKYEHLAALRDGLASLAHPRPLGPASGDSKPRREP